MFDNVMYVITIILLIGLTGLGYWIARQSLGLGGVSLFQHRQKRLGLVEATLIDGRRRLLLVRRDNVCHLILTGGPVDVVVETGIHLEDGPPQALQEPYSRTEPVLGTSETAFSGDIPLILQRDHQN
jgi:flagellar protein FliO/FliZ